MDAFVDTDFVGDGSAACASSAADEGSFASAEEAADDCSACCGAYDDLGSRIHSDFLRAPQMIEMRMDGRCALINPGLFDVNDDGYGVVLNPEPEGDAKADAVRAIGNCPEQAVSWAW